MSTSLVDTADGLVARATVQLVDAQGQPVERAEVYGAFTGAMLATARDTTAASGVAVMASPLPSGADGDVQFGVEAVSITRGGTVTVLYPSGPCLDQCSLSAKVDDADAPEPKDGPATSTFVEEGETDGPATSTACDDSGNTDGPATSTGADEETTEGPATSSGVEETTPGPATSSGVEAPTPGPATSSGVEAPTPGPATSSRESAPTPGPATST